MKVSTHTSKKISELNEALHFFHVDELKSLGLKLDLPVNGTKGSLIARIIYFLETKKIQEIPKTPKISCAEKGKKYPLRKDALILKGAYKNDLATRQFFKRLIGEHFHFTAFGIDWIKARWLKGKPPTYLEFAHFWQQEQERRKKNRAKPKQEWAYINFTQQFLLKKPKVSREVLLAAWEKERVKKLKIARQILQKFSKP